MTTLLEAVRQCCWEMMSRKWWHGLSTFIARHDLDQFMVHFYGIYVLFMLLVKDGSYISMELTYFLNFLTWFHWPTWIYCEIKRFRRSIKRKFRIGRFNKEYTFHGGWFFPNQGGPIKKCFVFKMSTIGVVSSIDLVNIMCQTSMREFRPTWLQFDHSRYYVDPVAITCCNCDSMYTLDNEQLHISI